MAILSQEIECAVCQGSGIKPGSAGEVPGSGEMCLKCKGNGFLAGASSTSTPTPVSSVPNYTTPLLVPSAPPLATTLIYSSAEVVVVPNPHVPPGEMWIFNAATGVITKVAVP